MTDAPSPLPNQSLSNQPEGQLTSQVDGSTLPPHWNYEMTVSEVEAIISRLEVGELELSEVFDQFATAVERLRQCETFLVRQQQQVDLLIETLLDEPEPF